MKLSQIKDGLQYSISIEQFYCHLPKLQMSATQSYPISWITSGAIQYGVPITVFRLAIVSWCKIIHNILNFSQL